jgi:hypothetical protein
VTSSAYLLHILFKLTPDQPKLRLNVDLNSDLILGLIPDLIAYHGRMHQPVDTKPALLDNLI